MGRDGTLHHLFFNTTIMKKLIAILLFLPALLHAQTGPALWDLSRIAVVTGPTIVIGQSSLSFTSVAGTPPTAQSISYTFSALTASNGAIALPSFTEGSIDGGSTYHASFSGLASGSGTLLLRVTAATTTGSYGPTNVSFSATGATSRTCAITATVSASASLSALPSSITGLNGTAGTAGTPQTVTATFVGTTVTGTAPTNTELSQDGGSTYSGSQVFSSGSPLALKIRTTAAASAGAISGNLSLAGTAGVTTVTIPITGTVSTGATVYAFAMSLTSYTPPTGFVNLFGDPSTGVRTATSNGATISTVATANWEPYLGAAAGDGNGNTGSTIADFPDNVLLNSYYSYSGSGHTVDSVTQTMANPNFTITGLTPSHTYSIVFVGSLVSSDGFTCANKYRVRGAADYVTGVLNAHANTTAETAPLSVTTDGSGNLKIYCFTEVGQQLAIINGIKLQ